MRLSPCGNVANGWWLRRWRRPTADDMNQHWFEPMEREPIHLNLNGNSNSLTAAHFGKHLFCIAKWLLLWFMAARFCKLCRVNYRNLIQRRLTRVNGAMSSNGKDLTPLTTLFRKEKLWIYTIPLKLGAKNNNVKTNASFFPQCMPSNEIYGCHSFR